MQKQKDNNGKSHALLIRLGEYDVTPALGRFVSVLRSVRPEIRVAVLCWGHARSAQTGVRPPPDIEFMRHESLANSHAPLRAALAVLGWWLVIARALVAGNYTLVQPSDVISMVPCILLKPFLRYKFIVDVRDPVRSVTGHWGWRAIILGFVESVGLRLADRVIICDEHRRRFVPDSVILSKRDLVIRNLPDVDVGYHPSAIASDCITVCFSGYINSCRGVSMLLGALKQCPFITLHVVGSISEPGLQSRLTSSSQVVMHGRVSRVRAMDIMSESNLVALLYDPGVELNRYASPNKFYEALMLGVPVLTCEGTPMAAVVETASCGYIVKYDDVDALVGMFRSLREDPASWSIKSQKARQLYERDYRWEQDANKLAQVYQQFLT